MANETPSTVPWPPIIFGGLVIVGLLLHHIHPFDLPANLSWLGYMVLAIGISLDIWAMAAMAKARTSILPHRAADHLVTSGPFSFMRNPIYVGNTIATAGLGMTLQNGWLLLATPVAVLATHHLAVVREQAHLQQKFGKEWSDYAARVKPWWLI